MVDLTQQVLRLTGATSAAPIAGGHQADVFDVMSASGRRIVAKVLDSSVVDEHEATERVTAVAELADLDERVCAPVPIDGRLVNTIDHDGQSRMVLCFDFAEGAAFDVTRPVDAELMGSTLAGLHRALARLGPRHIPELAALKATGGVGDAGPVQLLHGDFNAGNLRRAGAQVRVFDFEDCGYGPPSFEIANTLYMVLFSATVDGEVETYPRFEDALLSGYASGAVGDIDRSAVDRFIDLRVRALGSWLDDLSTAPVGIRNASPAWHGTLRAFVDRYAPRTD